MQQLFSLSELNVQAEADKIAVYLPISRKT